MGTGSKKNRLEIARRIKNARKNAGFTQVEVARKLELTPQAISNYERGVNSVPASILFAMRDLYGMREFTFLDGLPEPYPFDRVHVDEFSDEGQAFESGLKNELRAAPSFIPCGIIQDKIKELKPNDIELYLAKLLQYGSDPDMAAAPAFVTRESVDYAFYILDAMRYLASHSNNQTFKMNYARLDELVHLLQYHTRAAMEEHMESYGSPDSFKMG